LRIAFAVEEDNGLSSVVSEKFGRARYLVIIDVNGEGDVRLAGTVVNPGSEAKSGAAMKTVQKLVKENVDVIVAGAFGPNALAGLEELGIKHYEIAGIKISEALERVLKEVS